MAERDIRESSQDHLEGIRPSVSVGALIEWGYRSTCRTHLLLVRANDGWGVPAGSLEHGEKSIDTVLREIREETRIPPNHIIFLSGENSTPTPDVAPVYMGDFIKNDRLYVGIIFRTYPIGIRFQKEGWSITNDPSIHEVRAFNVKGLLKLLQSTLDKKEPEKSLRISEFNFEVILKWVLKFPHFPPYVAIKKFLDKNREKIEGLRIDRNGHYHYIPPNTTKYHNPDVKGWLNWTRKFETVEDILKKSTQE